MKVTRRIGIAPSERPDCTETGNCPDGFELESGHVALIGAMVDISELADLPADNYRPPPKGELPNHNAEAVVIPRHVLLAIFADLEQNGDWPEQIPITLG